MVGGGGGGGGGWGGGGESWVIMTEGLSVRTASKTHAHQNSGPLRQVSLMYAKPTTTVDH